MLLLLLVRFIDLHSLAVLLLLLLLLLGRINIHSILLIMRLQLLLLLLLFLLLVPTWSRVPQHLDRADSSSREGVRQVCH
jgi:hypothetical protein